MAKSLLERLLPERGFIRQYVDLYEPRSEASAEAHLATALAILSAAVGWRAHIDWGGSKEPCCLYILLEGESAVARKTTTVRTGSALVRTAMDGVETHDSLPPLAVRSVSHISRRGLIEMVAPPDEATAKLWEDVPPPGNLLEFDEIGALLGRPGDTKGADWLGQLRATLMEFTGGRHGGIQTGGEKARPSRVAVSLLGTITRKELEQRVTHGLLRDGFMGRFILIPHPGRTRYLSRPPKWRRGDADARDELAAFLRRIATSKQEIGSIFDRMTEKAQTLRDKWYEDRMRELDQNAREGSDVEIAMADAMARLQSTAVKIAAILAVSEMAGTNDDLGEVWIETDHVYRGITVAEFALAEIRDLALIGGDAPTDQYGRRVVDYLRSLNGHGTVRRKDLMDALRGDGLDAATRWKVVERLHEEGSVVIDIVQTGGRPRQEISLPTDDG